MSFYTYSSVAYHFGKRQVTFSVNQCKVRSLQENFTKCESSVRFLLWPGVDLSTSP